jgi:predicted nucleic acid-binding protein
MNIVDSSGWLEYFADGRNAKHFLPALKDNESLVVPTVSLYEVFKVVLRERGEHQALQAVSAMQRGLVAELTPGLSISAAKFSIKHSLPMADSIILATARLYEATLWTQDADFKGLPDVKYFPKKM